MILRAAMYLNLSIRFCFVQHVKKSYQEVMTTDDQLKTFQELSLFVRATHTSFHFFSFSCHEHPIVFGYCGFFQNLEESFPLSLSLWILLYFSFQNGCINCVLCVHELRADLYLVKHRTKWKNAFFVSIYEWQ